MQGAVQMIDAKMKELSAPADKLKLLLSSKDKKATLLEMAGQSMPKSSLSYLQEHIKLGLPTVIIRDEDGECIQDS